MTLPHCAQPVCVRVTHHGLPPSPQCEKRVVALLLVDLQQVEGGQLGPAQAAAVAVAGVVVHLLLEHGAEPAATAGHGALEPAHLLTGGGRGRRGIGSGHHISQAQVTDQASRIHTQP